MGKFGLWLALGIVGAALAVATAPAVAAPASDADWAKIVAAAKQEGKIVISHFTDAGMEPVLRQFEKDYGIRVEATPGRPDAVIPKILTEQQNGQYNWDVLLQPVNNVRLVLEPAHGLEPILPFLKRADVDDDAQWYGGITAHVPMDPPYVFYDGISNLAVGIDVDRAKVPASEMSNWPDLLKPEWKGKFGIYYPGRPANLTLALTCYRPAFDSDAKWEDYVRAFFAQQPTASAEFRTVADWLVQGRFAVTVGAEGSYLENLEEQAEAQDRGAGQPESLRLSADGHRPLGVDSEEPARSQRDDRVRELVSLERGTGQCRARLQCNRRGERQPTQGQHKSRSRIAEEGDRRIRGWLAPGQGHDDR